jgi:hypothetical protein
MAVEHGDGAAMALLPIGRALMTGGYTFIGSSGSQASVETFEESPAP